LCVYDDGDGVEEEDDEDKDKDEDEEEATDEPPAKQQRETILARIAGI